MFDNGRKCERSYILTTAVYQSEAKLRIVVEIITFYGFSI